LIKGGKLKQDMETDRKTEMSLIKRERHECYCCL